MQREFAPRVVHEDRFGAIKTIAGVDVAFPDRGRTTRAAALLFSFPDLVLLDKTTFEEPTRLAYIPGLLSFREVPAIAAALERLPAPPDVVLCDGQGFAHPRRFGSACHLGVALDLPTIGVAKSVLVGDYSEPEKMRGSQTALIDGDQVIGTALRTRTGVKPVFVSIGHRVSLASANNIVLKSCSRYRLPDPIRGADKIAGEK
ncbi:MAG: deoxyribonuclease V [Pseudomonadota bacterium]